MEREREAKRQRERDSREEGENLKQAPHPARILVLDGAAQSHDPEIITWAKIKS